MLLLKSTQTHTYVTIERNMHKILQEWVLGCQAVSRWNMDDQVHLPEAFFPALDQGLLHLHSPPPPLLLPQELAHEMPVWISWLGKPWQKEGSKRQGVLSHDEGSSARPPKASLPPLLGSRVFQLAVVHLQPGRLAEYLQLVKYLGLP